MSELRGVHISELRIREINCRKKQNKKQQEGIIMNSFYTRLAEELKKNQDEIWVETILAGERAGEKRLLRGREAAGELPDEPGQAVLESGGKVFRERAGLPPHLVVCGAGHVSMPVIRIGKMIGFYVTVLEDRPKFADNARAAGADEVICLPFEAGLAGIEGNKNTWFVIVTRGHRYDEKCLEAILKKKYAYVGMMGSRRRTEIVREQLEKKGYDRAVLNRLHAPVGLNIHAETPEEIAVSIMAEIIQIKNKDRRTGGYPEELLQALIREDGEKKVLAVIISRKGSAPRGVGTKMLIRENGVCTGTIGGGCIESEIIQKAIVMMRMDTPAFQVCTVDMTAGQAEDEGMVCGGVVEVMLERVTV